MDEKAAQINLNTIKEMVLDEQRLVTYVSISKELCIHVNHSKTLLHEFVEDIKKKQSHLKLNVYYVVSGITEDKKGRTTVCSEVDIDKVKATLKTVFFCHLYSVSKGSSTVDDVAFLSVNKLGDLPLCTGLIKNNLCVKRSADEIGKLKWNSQESKRDEEKVIVPPKKVKEELKSDLRNGQDNNKSVSKPQEAKSEPIIHTEKKSPKKEPQSSTKGNDKKNGLKSQKGIAGFFTKSNSDPGKKSSKEDTKVTPKEEKPDKLVQSVVSPVKNKNKAEKMEVDEEVDVEKEEKPLKKETGKAKPKNKTITEIKKNAKVDKKRKRVLQVSDSESDEDKDPFLDETPETPNNESEDEIPPTPANNTVKVTSGIINPKKRRKIVDKTYTDEDGYILTKKEEVYESCSDNDEVDIKENVEVSKNQVKAEVKVEVSPKAKKTGPKATKKKVSPPTKGKQATMMNFFKKV